MDRLENTLLLKREAIDMSDIIKEIMETSGDKISIFRLLDSEERKKIGEFLERVRYPA